MLVCRIHAVCGVGSLRVLIVLPTHTLLLLLLLL
jgi:hypothetical protein